MHKNKNSKNTANREANGKANSGANSKSNKTSTKRKAVLNELWASTRKDRSNTITTEQKREFVEAVRKFNEFGQFIYREQKLNEITDQVVDICEAATLITIKESEGTFDNVVVERDMKKLKEAQQIFANTTTEISKLQHRLESIFEEIGGVLGKYYEIYDLEDMSNNGGNNVKLENIIKDVIQTVISARSNKKSTR